MSHSFRANLLLVEDNEDIKPLDIDVFLRAVEDELAARKPREAKTG